jgi:large subunit ribosomal protein L13
VIVYICVVVEEDRSDMKTFMAKAEEVDRKWYVIDADGKPLGRLASEVAKILRGKNKPTYTPHIDTGDHVIVLNAEKVVLTGNKLDQKIYRHYSGWIGGMKEVKYRQMMEKTPEKAVELAVKGMLPHNSLGRAIFRKLKVYKGAEHEHQAQQPEILEINV